MAFQGFNQDSQEARLHRYDSLVNRKGSGLKWDAPKPRAKVEVLNREYEAKLGKVDSVNGRYHSVTGKTLMTPDHPQWQRLPEHVQTKLLAQLGL
jgi:hypothetical protein